MFRNIVNPCECLLKIVGSRATIVECYSEMALWQDPMETIENQWDSYRISDADKHGNPCKSLQTVEIIDNFHA